MVVFVNLNFFNHMIILVSPSTFRIWEKKLLEILLDGLIGDLMLEGLIVLHKGTHVVHPLDVLFLALVQTELGDRNGVRLQQLDVVYGDVAPFLGERFQVSEGPTVLVEHLDTDEIVFLELEVPLRFFGDIVTDCYCLLKHYTIII